MSDPRTWQEYVPTGYAPSPWALRHMRPLDRSERPGLTATMDPDKQTSHYRDEAGCTRTPVERTQIGTDTSPMADED